MNILYINLVVVILYITTLKSHIIKMNLRKTMIIYYG